MIIYIDELLREINILNWYRGEAVKNGDPNAVMVQSNVDEQDALIYHIKTTVTDILSFANPNNLKFLCNYSNDRLEFSISPVREGREYMLDLLKNCIKQYLVYEVRRLWMMNVRPEWADATMRESLRMNIKDTMSACTCQTKKVRRRCATMGI